LGRFLRRLGGTAFILGMLVTPASLATSAARTHTFTLSTKTPAWLNTGLNIPAGTTAQIVVTGGNGTCHAGARGCPKNPAGAGFLCNHTAMGLVYRNGPAGPHVPYGAVAGRVGPHGKPFLVGHHVGVKGPGELYLVYNDCAPPAAYRDNRGAWTVRVTGA
jgi:hypothetical protein